MPYLEDRRFFAAALHRLALLRVVLAMCLVACAVVPAAAAGAPSKPEPLEAHAYRMAGDATRVRVVMEFDREPEPKWFLLRSPHRLVIDLPETRFAFIAEALEARGLVARVRYGNMGVGLSRVILESSAPFLVENLAVLENETSPGHRMVVDLVASSERQFEAALADQSATTGATPTADKNDRLADVAEPEERPFTVVIDPGHGGIDGGAEGTRGTVEKDLTLSFSKELFDALKAGTGYRVFMTREDDTFLRLDERVQIARQHEADLFISIHADTIRYRSIRGATVYTISEKASDDVARAAAARENLADAFAGIEITDENQEVADILVDLVRRETHGFSVNFARSLVSSLTPEISLIKNPHRSAGFRVLRAPDVPSVLLELGYLSNPEDEAQLSDATWRGRAIRSIVEAIGAYAAATGGARG